MTAVLLDFGATSRRSRAGRSGHAQSLSTSAGCSRDTPATGWAQAYRRLRPYYRTTILSNSFVGAREHEQALYGFEDAFDHVIYSHEEGLEPENVAGAEAIGMHAVLFMTTDEAVAALEEVLTVRTRR